VTLGCSTNSACAVGSVERADGAELAALAVHALDGRAQHVFIDLGAASPRDVGGALARDLDEAAREKRVGNSMK